MKLLNKLPDIIITLCPELAAVPSGKARYASKWSSER
jgi:hypothetical protein